MNDSVSSEKQRKIDYKTVDSCFQTLGVLVNSSEIRHVINILNIMKLPVIRLSYDILFWHPDIMEDEKILYISYPGSQMLHL